MSIISRVGNNMHSISQKTISLERRRGAFTLVELLAVVAVMLIILRLTLPSLDGLLGADAEGMARTQVVGDLNRARQMALQRGLPVYMVFMPLYGDMAPNISRPVVQYGSDTFNEVDKRNYFAGDKGVNELLGSQLTSYAIYAEYLPGDQPGIPSTEWLSDWKNLPAGYHFNRDELKGLREITVTYLKGNKTTPTAALELPCIKFNRRGEMESPSGGRELNGVYLSVSKGGVLQQRDSNTGLYLRESADPPESVAEDDRKWLYVNGITGRSEIKELSEGEAAAGLALQNSEYELYIMTSPEHPSNFVPRLPFIRAQIGVAAIYKSDWFDPADDWPASSMGFDFKPNPGDPGLPNPAFTGLKTRRDAIKLKWAIEEWVKLNPSFAGLNVKVRVMRKK